MTVKQALTDLKAALIDLDPIGKNGFEGFLAVVLEKITGHPFKLAGAGSQHGKDGEALSWESHITFETKLYTTHIPKNEVLSKATEIIGARHIPDLWILGATVVVKPQISEPLRNAFEKNAVSLVILDWPETVTIPPLACACTLAEKEAIDFLGQHIQDKDKVTKAKAALSEIRSSESFEGMSETLRRDLLEPTLGAPIAVKNNREWLAKAFSDRKRARQVFGQALAPMASTQLPMLDRPQLHGALEKSVFDKPHTRVVALVGGEGCGKSWLFAKSWSQIAEPPLTIIISASDLKEVAAYGQIEPYLITRLIEQTGDSVTEFRRQRWQRRFDQWKACKEHSEVKLVAFVDGLNQNPEFEWGRWLNGANEVIERLGGALVVSVREAFFRDRLQDVIYAEIEPIQVPEWTREELEQMLSKREIQINDVSPGVAQTLQNPRILAVAFELLGNTQIENFSELSVERLLFEHIRIGARDNAGTENPEKFTRRLSQHAEEILDRVKSQNQEDTLIFESGTSLNPKSYELSEDLLAVTRGSFFHPLPEDSTLYSLTDVGLSVALGISIIRALQKAERNDKNVAETLDDLLDPVAALDKTSQAVFSAVLIASVDERCTIGIRKALIEAFLRQQNIDTGYYPAFSSVARMATEAAMHALFDLSTSKRHVSNKDWLLAALRDQRKHQKCWEIISKEIDRWLRLYSLAPELSVLSSHTGEGKAKVKKEIEERRECIEKRLRVLPNAEKEFLEQKMRRDDGIAPSSIANEAFTLLAGMPLADFGGALAAWCYSQSLNSSYRTPHEEFQFLVQHNKQDWAKTRENLLESSSLFRAKDASSTAKWAMVAIWRSTSTLNDAKSASALYDELTANREKHPGWRLVEKYCPTDPCDPASSEPVEFKATVERYRQVGLSETANSQWMGANDHFLRDALPGMARFAGDVAADVQRSLAANIVKRDGREFKLGLFSLESNTAILKPNLVKALLQQAQNLCTPYDKKSNETRDRWVESQYSLLIALPHLDGDEQLNALMSLPHHGPMLLKLIHIFKPAKSDSLDRALNLALQNGDKNKQTAVLTFARYSGTRISMSGQKVVGQLCTSTNSGVRTQALNIIAHLKDHSLLKVVANGTWRADALDPKEQYFEVWYGSEVLIEAGTEKIISEEDVLTRISPKLYGSAAGALGQLAQTIVAGHLHAVIKQAIDVDVEKQPPTVEQNINPENSKHPPLLSLTDVDDELRPEDFFKRLSETPEELSARQGRAWKAFDEFGKMLTFKKARIIIEEVGINAIEMMLKATPECSLKWAETFLELPNHKLRNVQHVALVLARGVSGEHQELARKLFERLQGQRGFVKFTNGLGAIPLEAISIWRSADSSEIDTLRSKRLDAATNDSDLASEVLAALTSGKSDFLEKYCAGLLERAEPAAIARALMVYGFGAESSRAEKVLGQYEGAKGLIGTSVDAARFAYNRNRWSRRWFELMCEAKLCDDFWRYSILFLKIVDARFELWEDKIERTGIPSRNFEPSIKSELQNRIKSWARKREKTLFGAMAPGSVFLLSE